MGAQAQVIGARTRRVGRNGGARDAARLAKSGTKTMAPPLRSARIMVAIPHVAGSECVAVLEQLGWRESHRSRGLVTLRWGDRTVLVPEVATLGPCAVDSILVATRIEPLEFVRVLAALRRAA